GITKFGTLGSAPLAFITNNIERMRIDASGNLIIGTTSATGKLDIAGGSSSTFAVVRVSAGFTAGIRLAGNGTGVGSGSFDLQQDSTGAVDIVNRSLGRMSFYTNNIERMRIDSNGLVGIGKTPSTYALEVNGDVQASVFRGSGAALTGITSGQVSGLAASATTDATNAANISAGTLPSGRISGAVAYDISAATVNSSAVGYRGLPAASVTTGAFVAADAGKCVYATG